MTGTAKSLWVELLGRVERFSTSFQLDAAASKVTGLDTSNGLLVDQMSEVVGLGGCNDTLGPADGLSCLVNLNFFTDIAFTPCILIF